MKIFIYGTAYLASLLILICFSSCKKSHQAVVNQYNIAETNLVADTAGYGATTIDPNLLNAWGIAANPMGIIWISSNHKAASAIYDKTGKALRAPVTIPSVTPNQPGAPSGIVFNGTTDFGGNKFIFAGEDGVITAWASGNAAVKVVDWSASNAVYKGLAMATDAGANFIYAANFKGGKIDVFDSNFNYVTSKPFLDPTIPAGFGPFNIQNIGGWLYVTYAKLKAPDNMDDQAGPGNGYVNIFKPDGTLVKRFASQGTLNSPWGITHAPAGFAGDAEAILVGNFGDGRINIFDLQGNYKGQLQNNGQVVAIDGLWAIDFLNPNASATDLLYFTAGPGGEAHGLFGFLQKTIVTGGYTQSSGGY
ncbi:MAG TPA: TIGR03118 family protein [Mucilaginibacter sp.]|nr:TIGR03118 family protein [Mucilaginibacter sp.]